MVRQWLHKSSTKMLNMWGLYAITPKCKMDSPKVTNRDAQNDKWEI